MSKSKILDINAGSIAFEQIVEPTAFTSATLGTQDIFENADLEKICSPNSVIKYINVRFETGLRDTAPAAPGFIEYAMVVLEEQAGAYIIPAGITAGFSTKTIGDMARQQYRGNCIWNGSFPVSREIPMVYDMKIKIPDKFCKNKVGKAIILLIGHHGLNVADVTTDARTFFSHQYKCYI